MGRSSLASWRLYFTLTLLCLALAVDRASAQNLAPAPVAMPPGLNFGLGALPLLTDARTRSISPENPTGEKGKGAMMVPKLRDPEQPHANLFAHLGRGWKTRPFLSLKAGKTATLADVKGPGIIQHIWIVSDEAPS